VKVHIALVGMMGSGKSSVGKALAQHIGRRFVDTDDLIVAARGATIPHIFEEEGEPAFRRYEFEALCAALEGEPAIVATGGGTLMHAPSRALLDERAVRIYLELSTTELCARLRRSRTPRPALGGRPTPERVAAIVAARDVWYRQAEIVLPCDRMKRTLVVRTLVELLAARAS
jgi:shikimate kinase